MLITGNNPVICLNVGDYVYVSVIFFSLSHFIPCFLIDNNLGCRPNLHWLLLSILLYSCCYSLPVNEINWPVKKSLSWCSSDTVTGLAKTDIWLITWHNSSSVTVVTLLFLHCNCYFHCFHYYHYHCYCYGYCCCYHRYHYFCIAIVIVIGIHYHYNYHYHCHCYHYLYYHFRLSLSLSLLLWSLLSRYDYQFHKHCYHDIIVINQTAYAPLSSPKMLLCSAYFTYFYDALNHL